MEAIQETPALFAECPVWLAGPQRLYWIDCAGGRLFSLDWRSRRVESLLSMPGTLFSGLVKLGPSALLLLTSAGGLLVDQNGRTADVALPAPIDVGLLNDGKCDARGQVWIGQVRSAPGFSDGVLYRLSGKIAAPVVSGLGIPNGPAFDPAGGGLYLADSLAGTVNVFSLRRDGVVVDKRLLLQLAIEEGQPDGMTVDINGNLLVAVFDGGALLRIDSVTSLAERISLPIRKPTSCTFGGPDLKTLFVTVANGAWPANRRNPGSPPPANAEMPSLYAISMAIPGIAEPDCRMLTEHTFATKEVST